MLPTWTMRPLPAERIAGNSARVRRKGARRFTSSCSSSCSGCVSSTLARWMTAALLMSASGATSSSSTRRAAVSNSRADCRLQAMLSTRTPRARASLAVRSCSADGRPSSANSTPRLASSKAVARPMPRLAPVSTALVIERVPAASARPRRQVRPGFPRLRRSRRAPCSAARPARSGSCAQARSGTRRRELRRAPSARERPPVRSISEA